MMRTHSLGRLGVQMLENGSAAVIWIEKGSQGSQFRVRIINSGRDSFSASDHCQH